MFVVITGLDGSGTSSIAQEISLLDNKSHLLKTPSLEYRDRDSIDENVKNVSKVAHMLYYLSSTVYMSDYIKCNFDLENENVYLVRYLIDTVVSNRVAGIPIDLNYNIYGNELLVPDATVFVSLNEKIRQQRISSRGKSTLDKVLDDNYKRNLFLQEFKKLLDPLKTVYVCNDSEDIVSTAKDVYQRLLKMEK